MCKIGDGSIGITAEKLIEDYILSVNIARFGLKHLTIEGQLKQKFGRGDAFYWHQYTISIDEKVLQCLSIMNQWGMLTPEIQEQYKPLITKIQAKHQEQMKLIQQQMAMGIRPTC